MTPGGSSLSVVEAGPPHRAAEVLAVRAPRLRRPAGARPAQHGPGRDARVGGGGAERRRWTAGAAARPCRWARWCSTRAVPGRLGLRRVSVDPAHQGHGVASAMVGVAEDIAEDRGLDGVWLWAREELPENLRLLAAPRLRRGRARRRRRSGWPRRCGWPGRCPPPTTPARSAGGSPPSWSRGDLVVLTGGLGAGKTTLDPGHRRRAGRTRRRSLADVRDLAGAPVAVRRARPRARRRLPARRCRRARRPRPGRLAGRRRDRGRVGGGDGREAGRVAGSTSASTCSTRAARRPSPRPGPDRDAPVLPVVDRAEVRVASVRPRRPALGHRPAALLPAALTPPDVSPRAVPWYRRRGVPGGPACTCVM